MRLVYFSLFGLIILFIADIFSVRIFKIHNDRFYSPFHFLGGLLTTFLFLGLYKNIIIALSLTIITGILWEIGEWLLWKLILKKQKYKPEARDTLNDLILDFLGGIIAVLFWII